MIGPEADDDKADDDLLLASTGTVNGRAEPKTRRSTFEAVAFKATIR